MRKGRINEAQSQCKEGNVDEMGKFLEICNVPKLTPKDIDN